MAGAVLTTVKPQVQSPMLKRCSSTLTGCAVIGALLLAGLPGGAAFAQTPPPVNDDHERRLQRLERVLENQIG